MANLKISMQNPDSKTRQRTENKMSGMGFEPIDTSHKITQLGCTLCGAIIGEHGTVKGAKINGHKLLAALCENHAGMPITKFMTEN